MADLNVTLVLDDSEYTGKLNNATNAIDRFGKQADTSSKHAAAGFERISASAESVQRKMELFTTALLGAGVFEFAKKSMEMADNITDLSAATDVSVPKILQLREAFEANGGSADKLYRIINKLSNSLYDAREGSAVAQENLLKLGLSFKEMANLNTEEAMGKVIEKLAAMSDVTERQALAFRVFGKDAMKIDWAGVAAGTKGGTDEFLKYTESLEKAGQAHDKLAAAAEKLMIAFVDLMGMSGVLDAINGMDDSMAKFEKTIAVVGAAIVTYFGAKAVITMVEFGSAIMKATEAIAAMGVAMNLLEKGTAFGRIASLVTILAAAGAAYMGWDKLNETIDENDKKRTEDAKKRAEELAAAKAGGKGGDKPAVVPAWQKEIVQLDQLSEAYKKTNDEALQKINIDRRMIGLGEDQKQMEQELITLTRNYNNELKNLNDRIAQEEATPQSAARDARIGQLKKEREQVTALYDQYLIKVPEAVRAQQAQAKLIRESNYDYQNQLDLQAQIKVVQQEYSKTTMTEIEKKYADIQFAAEKAAQAQIDAENKLLGFDTAGNKLKMSAEEEEKIREKARKRADDLSGVLDRNIEQSRKFSNGWGHAMNQFIEDTTNGAAIAEKVFSKMTQGLEDAFVDFVKTGKLNFKGLVDSMLEELLRAQFRKTMAGLMDMGGASGGSFLGSLLGFANGGPVSGNRPILVGERGPELFIPGGNGSIVPNNSLAAASGGQVNYFIQAVDAASFKTLVARDPAFIHSVAQAGARSYPRTSR